MSTFGRYIFHELAGKNLNNSNFSIHTVRTKLKLCALALIKFSAGSLSPRKNLIKV